jgi:2-dehydropantoate 2-reductase
MHIAVMGAGAVGCYYGGLLALAGHTVTLIARPQHVQAIAAQGLRLQTATSDEHIALQASADVGAIAHAELVLFCVKSSDTEAAGMQMRPHLRKDAAVLSLQNGVDNAQRLQAVLGQDVIPTVVYVATAMAGPGHVQHFGRGDLVLGQHPRSAQLAQLLSDAAIPSTVSGNVQGALWTKLIINCTYNAASAITQRPYGELVQVPGMWQLMRSAHDECMAVAQAAGVVLDAPLWPMIDNIARTMPGQFSSTAQDLQKNKATEIEHLNGFIVRRGQALGVATPVNAALHTLVKALQP